MSSKVIKMAAKKMPDALLLKHLYSKRKLYLLVQKLVFFVVRRHFFGS